MEWYTYIAENDGLARAVGVRVPSLRPMKVKYSKELLEGIVKDSVSVAEVIRKLDLKQSGGNHSHITRRIEKYEIDISHFRGKGSNFGTEHRGGSEKLLTDQVLVDDRLDGRRDSTFRLRRALIESGVEEKCQGCGLPPFWNGKLLVLQIDHINGNGTDNRKENLRFLCPCCHSQTENFGSKNRGL